MSDRTISVAELARRGWRRVDPKPWTKCGARWQHRDGWRLEHCGHPTALTPWGLFAPDGKLWLTGSRHPKLPHRENGTCWPDLNAATTFVYELLAGVRPRPAGA